MIDWPQLIGTVGFGGAFAVGFARWASRFVARVMNTNEQREMRMQNMIDNHLKHLTETLDSTNRLLTMHDERSGEASRRQREEHELILGAVRNHDA